jgi:hypothetical protein
MDSERPASAKIEDLGLVLLATATSLAAIPDFDIRGALRALPEAVVGRT